MEILFTPAICITGIGILLKHMKIELNFNFPPDI